MPERFARFYQFLLVLGDLLLLNGCFFLAGFLRFSELRLQETAFYDYYVQLFVFFNLLWLFLSLLLRTYELRGTLEPRKSTSRVANAFFIHLFTFLLLLFLLKKAEYSRLFLVLFYISFFITLLPWRFFFLRWLKALRKKGVGVRNVVLLGEGASLAKFYENVQEHSELGLRIIGHFSENQVDAIPHSGNERDFQNFSTYQKVDEIYCAYPAGDERLVKWFRFADENLLRFRILPDWGLENTTNLQIDFQNNVPFLLPRTEPLERLHNRLLKRAGDVFISVIVMVAVLPWLFPLIIIGLKASGKGPIFFRQKRSGLRDEVFTIYKFRTMVENAAANRDQAIKNDYRITPFGKFLRRHSLDELPQIFNVLKGEMSLVGPRPHMLIHTGEYRKLVDSFMVRHFAKPGLTGLAQIKGFRGEISETEDIVNRVRADVYYIENWSVLLDLKILFKTGLSLLIGFKN